MNALAQAAKSGDYSALQNLKDGPFSDAFKSAGVQLAVAAQGKGHAREEARPHPFRGALDVVARIFVEQWITFPRYVLSGKLASPALARPEPSSDAVHVIETLLACHRPSAAAQPTVGATVIG